MEATKLVVGWLERITSSVTPEPEHRSRSAKRVKVEDEELTPERFNPHIPKDLIFTPKNSSRKRRLDETDIYTRSPGSNSSSSVSVHSIRDRDARVDSAYAVGIRSERVEIGRLVQSPVHFVNLAATNPGVVLPESVVEIVKSFSDGSLGREFIPYSLQEALEKVAPLEEFYPEHFMPEENIDRDQAGELTKYLTGIINKSAKAFSSSNDESAWYAIVEKVLEFEMTDAEPASDDLFPDVHVPHFLVETSQSKQIHRHLFPVFPGRYQTRTVDFALQFNPENEAYASFYRNYENQNSSQPLSPFKDPTVKYIIPGLLVEVKAPGGDYFEAQYQGALATIASINHRKAATIMKGYFAADIKPPRDRTPELPLPFMTVIGHDWALHWVYQDHSNKSIVIGPVSAGSTASWFQALRLMNTLGRLKRWLNEEYWPWITAQYH